jgi:NAD(P)-dependent dehydrogenase (short-subunit alcohol dehydrogenase family)
MRLRGKVALVAGSTRGTGRAIAEMFSREGAKVVITGRTVERGEAVVKVIRDSGHEAEFVPLEITDEDSVALAVATTVERFGLLTTLVNNVTGTARVELAVKRLVDLSNEEWDAILLNALTGSVFWTCKHAIPHMVAAGGGSIINISTGQSLLGMGGFSAYGAAKAAMNSVARTIAVEEADHGIRANTIVSGRVVPASSTDAARNPRRLTRNVTPEDVAYAATWLASDESGVVTGCVINVDGGYSINGGNRVG